MPRTANIAIDKTFVGGRVSQATGLNFPENACVDELNCIFRDDGSVTRRYGFDLESFYEEKAADRTGFAVSSYLWKNAAGNGTLDLVVVQIGPTLHFYRTDGDLSLSGGTISDTVDLTDFSPAGSSEPDFNECQYASGLGFLFVVHPNCEPFSVEFDSTTENITTTEITIETRDFAGISEAVDVDHRDAAITSNHRYNLYNQGWTATHVATWDAARADFPSNADVWWLFRDPTDDSFDPSLVDRYDRGNSPAPRGHFILEEFNQDRATASGIGGLSTVATASRPSTVSFFAGRVWYSGLNDTGYNTKIFFSQIIETEAEFGKCHQRLDPSSETLFDLLLTDGGVINIPEAGTIYKLVPFGNNLLVFAHNGVWAITGSEGIGFTAKDYTVTSQSSVRSLSGSNFVDVRGAPMWWNLDGIYTVQITEQGGVQVVSITDQKIKDVYADIPFLSKRLAKGAFNARDHVVQWLYRSEAGNSIQEFYEYDRVLNLNILTGAFYFWSLPDDTPVPVHSIVVSDTGGSSTFEAGIVVAGADTVIDALGNTVITFQVSSQTSLVTTTKFLVTSSDGNISFAESAEHAGYEDWATVSATEYESYFIPGYKVPTMGAQKFQGNYVYTFSNSELDGQYTLQGQWNYANSGNSGKWSQRSIVTVPSTNYDYHRSRIKLRGHGYSLALKYASVDDQPFHIIGWSTLYTGNAGI
jgi:hypothetical protein